MTGLYRINFWTRVVFYGVFLLALSVSLFIPIGLWLQSSFYPDVDSVLSVMGLGGLCLLSLSGNKIGKLTISVRLFDDHFSVRKFFRLPKSYQYGQIIFHNQRKRKEKNQNWLEFYVYLENGDWFIIQSDEFNGYEPLKQYLRQFGEHRYLPRPGFYKDSLTKWAGRWLSMICIAGIIFGYAAHDDVKHQKAQLTLMNGTIAAIDADHSKSRFEGLKIGLREYSKFEFYADNDDYLSSIKPLANTLEPGRRVLVLIRRSEYEKKIIRIKMPTLGDKYVKFSRINVFAINSTKPEKPVYEDPHTSPALRAFLFGILFLFCLSAWPD